MNNQYYGHGRKGVQVGAMVNQSRSPRYTNKSNAGLYLIIFFVLLVAFVMCVLSVSSVGALANNTLRSEGCHTYNVFGHQDKSTNGTDYKMCDLSSGNVHKDSKDKPVITDSVSNDEVEITLPDNENVPDKPIVEDKLNDDNNDAPSLGNPGNDKEVGHAGEHCNQDMCENVGGVSGEHGRSDND